MKYESYDEATNRLSRSAIRIEGVWYFVSEVYREPLRLLVYPLPIKSGDKAIEIPLGTIETEMSVGYVNFTDYAKGYSEASFFQRLPVRSPRQGLSSSNIEEVGFLLDESRFGRQFNFEYLTTATRTSKDVFKMLINDYPSFEECSSLVLSGKKPCWAFHRLFALTRDPLRDDLVLVYKGERIGWFTQDNLLCVPTKFEHLRGRIYSELNLKVR